MKLIYKDDKCTLIAFDESVRELRKQGWLGDEIEARIFYPNGKRGDREIRVFKRNGESYVLKEHANDEMIDMKIRKIIAFANECN